MHRQVRNVEVQGSEVMLDLLFRKLGIPGPKPMSEAQNRMEDRKIS